MRGHAPSVRPRPPPSPPPPIYRRYIAISPPPPLPQLPPPPPSKIHQKRGEKKTQKPSKRGGRGVKKKKQKTPQSDPKPPRFSSQRGKCATNGGRWPREENKPPSPPKTSRTAPKTPTVFPQNGVKMKEKRPFLGGLGLTAGPRRRRRLLARGLRTKWRPHRPLRRSGAGALGHASFLRSRRSHWLAALSLCRAPNREARGRGGSERLQPLIGRAESSSAHHPIGERIAA